jgi:ABC-type Fe3+-hydroxamate transport system substrate-binding protein
MAALGGSAFTVVGPATQLAFTQQPSNGAPGISFPTQPTVTIEDTLGSLVTTDSTTEVTIALTGPGAGMLTCSGGLMKTAVKGVAPSPVVV